MKRNLSIKLPKAFLALCKEDGVDPELVVRGFIADLCGINNVEGYFDHGSDERMMAREYYERVGYPYWPGGSRDAMRIDEKYTTSQAGGAG